MQTIDNPMSGRAVDATIPGTVAVPQPEATMIKGNVLVVDDEKLIRWTLKEFLREAGYQIVEAENGKAALSALAEEVFDVVLLDYKLPDLNGLQILEHIQQEHVGTPVIMITAHSNVENAVNAMKAGASDYAPKPFRNEDILLRMEKVLETGRLRREVLRLRKDQQKRFGFDRMIGRSPSMQKVFGLVDRLLESRDATILIQGESGTGKDVLAKALHYGGSRADGPYMNITCTALPETLLESELFGHEKGAFTDARQQKKGLVELASGGTLFLDEVGDMTPYLQGKILRFLEEKSFRRVGGQQDVHVDVRVIAATNRNLKELVRTQQFREDLYFRLKVIPINLPPLRERKEDIPLLVQHFIDEYNKELRKSVKDVSPAVMKRLEDYHWPGNVRELKNTVERAMILTTNSVLDAQELPIDLLDEPQEAPASGSIYRLTRKGVNLEEVERDLTQQALVLARGNQTKAGRLLGINRDQVRYRIEKFKLDVPHHDVD